jgi:transcriptional regulator with XRE-family HTH domain
MPRKAPETPDVVDVHVGARVRAERVRRGLSQTELGQAIGVTFQQIQKYERGANRISASMLVRIARAVDVAIEDFFPQTDAAAQPSLDLGSIKGGLELAECYAKMSPGRRNTLLQVAREFAAPEG